MRGGSFLKARYILIVGIIVIAALVTAACGDDDGDDGDRVEPTAEATETADATDDGASPSPTAVPADTTAVIALDEWAVKPARTRARPGTVTFVVTNEGELTHGFVVIRTDIEKDELPRLPNEQGVDESDLDVIGRIDTIAPGQTAELVIEVEEGQYLILDNTFDGESHYLNGMYNEFEVTPTAPLDESIPVPTQ
jgi:uncharacterized cupredoxin-like copper-binding protein